MINNIIICGPSCSGKTSVARSLFYFLQNKGYDPNLVLSNTTRPKRLGEQDDIDYHFCTEEEFNSYNYLEQTEFRKWKYGIPIQNLKKNKCNILILNPVSIEKLAFKNNQYLIIYLYEYFFFRLIRSIKREKKISIEMLRRGFVDSINFRKFENFCYKKHIKYFKLRNLNIESTVKSIEKIFKVRNFFDNFR